MARLGTAWRGKAWRGKARELAFSKKAKTKKMKFAIYVRTSKIDMNPENQVLQLKRFADQKEWQYDLFEEQESTRKTRPIKQEVLKKLRNREYDGVLIWKLDRWARSLQELIIEIEEITNKGLQFVVMTAPIDTTTASGRLFLQIMGAFAEFEREIIRERTIAGLERAKALGKRLGRPTKGNEVYTDPSVEEVYKLRMQGLDIRSIADKLNTSKYRIERVLKKTPPAQLRVISQEKPSNE